MTEGMLSSLETLAADGPIVLEGEPLDVYLICCVGESMTRLALRDGDAHLVGRSPEAAIVVDERRVSRRHALVRRQGHRIFVKDLGGRNATLVGDERVVDREAEIALGDTIRIGPLDMVVAAATSTHRLARASDAATTDETESEDVVVGDPEMQRIFRIVRRLAETDTSVLLVGETGVGKEVVAERIHRLSARAGERYVRLNCASLPDTLLESELFGHEKGAFTGAAGRKIGYVEAADRGTLLLDEIGELPRATQVKLLRMLENRCIVRLGGTQEIPVDIRVIAATHRNLKGEIAAGRFREDLFYRISAFTVRVPPLRERQREILLLAELFVRRFAARNRRAPPRLDAATERALVAHAWPGNVRELRNVIEHALVLSEDGTVRIEHLPQEIFEAEHARDGGLGDQLASVERDSIRAALAAESNNQTRAAKRLGITRRALLYRMEKLGLKS